MSEKLFFLFFIFIIIILSILMLHDLFKGTKQSKENKEQVEEITNFKIKDDRFYHINNVEKARWKMTDMQKKYFDKSNISITIQGKVLEVEEKSNYIEVVLRGSTSYITAYCKFEKNDNLININRGELLNVKGCIRLSPTISLKNCELVAS